MPKNNIIFPENTLEFAKIHCNMDMEQYNNPPEIESTQTYFRNKYPRNVLELGCGLGRSSVGFYREFPTWEKTNFYLLDGDSGSEQICGVNYKTCESFYNKLELTKKFCLANGIPADQIHILNAEESEVFSLLGDIKFDFVYSFLAIGFHWPIGLYLGRLPPYLHQDSILCFGIRPRSQKRFCDFIDYQIDNIPNDKFDIMEVTTLDNYNSRFVLRKK